MPAANRMSSVLSAWEAMIPWLLWMAAIAAWCGYGFDPEMPGTRWARWSMIAALLAGGGWAAWRHWRGLVQEGAFRPLRVALPLVGLGLLASGLYWPGRPFRMYVTPKIVFLYPLSVLLAGWWVLNLGRDAVRRAFLGSPLAWLFLGMSVHLLVNTLVSGMPAVTFFGSANRQMGAVTLYACMGAALALALWVAREKVRALWFLRGWLAVGVIWALRAFYELDMPGVQVFRASGFAGNPDYFALQFHFTLLPALILYFSDSRTRWAAFYAAVTVTNVFALAIIQTRGAFLGVGIASGVGMLAFSPARHLEIPLLRRRLLVFLGLLAAGFALYYLYVGIVLPPEAELSRLPADRADGLRSAALNLLGKRASTALFSLFAISPLLVRAAWDACGSRRRQWALAGGLAALAAVLLAVPASRNWFLDAAHQAVRIRTLLDPKEGEARFHIWKDTLPMVRDHGLLGTGRETYRVRFLPYKTFELTTMAPTVNYRSSENMILDVLAMEGIPGLVLFAGMAFFGVVVSLRASRRDPASLHAPLLAGLGLALVGYLGHGLVTSDVIPTVFSFYMALGLTAGLQMQLQDEEREPVSLAFGATVLAASLAGFLGAGLSVVRHARTDTDLTELQRHAATLRGYQKAADELLAQARRVENLERSLRPALEGGNVDTLRASLAASGMDVRRMPADPDSARAWTRQAIERMKSAVRERERQLDAGMGPAVRVGVREILRRLESMLAWEAPTENLYNATHTASVLARLPDAYLTPPGRIEVLRLLLEAARRGTRDNTNPESAFSRLFSAHYALARALEDAGRKDEARIHFQESEKALQKSIDFDRLYYDTHRLKAVLLLERYCDAKGARREAEAALRILRASRPSKEIQDVAAGIERGVMAQVRLLEENPALLRACRERAGLD